MAKKALRPDPDKRHRSVNKIIFCRKKRKEFLTYQEFKVAFLYAYVKGYAMRRVVTIFFIFVIAFTVLGCHKETEEDKVKKVITDCQKAGEEKDIRKFMNNLSKTYTDSQGFNYEGIKGLLVGYFFQHPKITVYINNLSISVENTSARALFQSALTSGEKTGTVTDVIPQSLGIWNFDVSLKKESNEWKITQAKWEQVE